MIDILGAYRCSFVDKEKREVDYYRLLIGETEKGGGYGVGLVKATQEVAKQVVSAGGTVDNVMLLYDKYGRVVQYSVG